MWIECKEIRGDETLWVLINSEKIDFMRQRGAGQTQIFFSGDDANVIVDKPFRHFVRELQDKKRQTKVPENHGF